MILNVIREAMLAKLGGINGSSPYTTTPALVTTRKALINEYDKYPVLVLRHLGGQTIESRGFQHVLRVSNWALFLFAKDEKDEQEACMSLMADATRAIESDQTLGLSPNPLQDYEGRAVQMDKWEAWDLAKEVARGYAGWHAEISATYLALNGEI